MKTLATPLLFFLLLQVFSSLAQPYQPVGIENAHWIMFTWIDWLPAPDHHAFVLRGDTTVGNQAYKKIYYQDLANNQWPLTPPYLLEGEHLWGVVRDDSLERKVYVIAFEPYEYGYHCTTGEEQLLFDFSISPGDSTAHCLWIENFSPWILDSTYVSYKYGADRRTLYTGNGFPCEIYEGIGSNNGLFGTLTYFITISEDYYWLEEYCIGADEDCGIISGVRDIAEPEALVKVFPSPASEDLNLQFASPIHGALRIFDTMGRQCWSGETSGEPSLKVALDGWAPGFYLLQVEEKGRRFALKFIKVQQ